MAMKELTTKEMREIYGGEIVWRFINGKWVEVKRMSKQFACY